MVLERAGTPANEEDVRSRWSGSKRGYALCDGATLLGGAFFQLNPDDPNNYAFLRAMIQDGRWVIAQMFTSLLGGILLDRIPPLTSAHGPLPGTGFFRHVVVLIEATPDGFWCLDPWFRTVHQPIFLDNASFARAFQGSVAVSRPLP